MRIVVGVTTIPSGISGLKEVIYSLVNQRHRQPDKIYVNIPYLFLKTNEKYPDIDELSKEISSAKNNPHSVEIEIVRCEDQGPITKLYPLLDREKDGNTRILLCDDDYIVSDRLINEFEAFAAKRSASKNACLTTGGWVRGTSNTFPMFQGMSGDKSRIRDVDWIEGSGFMFIPRKFLPVSSAELLDYSLLLKDADPEILNLFKKHDDHWISWNLKLRGARLLSIPVCLTKGRVLSRKDYHISGGSIFGYWKFASEVNTISKFLQKRGIYNHKANMYPLPLSLFFLFLLLLFIVTMTIAGLLRKKYKAHRAKDV